MLHPATVPLFSRFAEKLANGEPSNPYLEMAATVFVAAALMVFIARFTRPLLRTLLSKFQPK
ncbi:hypothetical protein [Collimonas humicola]|uniref:hypothetical protein n=1 Tax=Collimonas humicola TaxID=2825886 RepID=UPI001B8BFE38|nr:hypothetical protein [Collimonas humicola]